MANITLTELHITGSELFQDYENFLNELSDVDYIYGGTDSYSNGISDISTLVKLAEAFVDVYAIGHIAWIAKSFSKA
ncbi:hypothetical protein NIES4103_63340 [Nostoc sp. NIES-4103]|nr:hypothetical protein NIES4103_63340 [Nostoc sp. NIES-4103]